MIRVRADDPLQTVASPESHWGTTNLAEAYPGVLTPLDWTVVGPATERGTRGALHAIGALPASETDVPESVDERIFGVFNGRIASRLDFFYRLGGLMPGTTPDAVVEQIFAVVPPGMRAESSKRRYPAIAARFPVTFALAPRRSEAMRRRTYAWWANQVRRMPDRDEGEARAAFRAGVGRLTQNLTTDGIALLAGAQPIYDQLAALAEAMDVDATALLSGYGSHEEAGVVRDIWRCSRGYLDPGLLVSSYGYHGPREGVLSGRVWREDPDPLFDLIAAFKRLGEDTDPDVVGRAKRQARKQAERELLAALPAGRRPGARLLLRLARTYMPLRGKAARTQALDVTRAAARRLGQCLAAKGVLEAPDDVLFLTADEVAGAVPQDAGDVVTARRERYERYLGLQLPSTWQGQPEEVQLGGDGNGRPTDGSVSGIGASSGVAEQVVYVMSDPAEADQLKGGEVLVASTTDPSWAPAMYLASALVVDIGGLMSHAAIVARELGVPCVMGTKNGTSLLRSGDTVRVDGKSGEVLILSRAGEPAST